MACTNKRTFWLNSHNRNAGLLFDVKRLKVPVSENVDCIFLYVYAGYYHDWVQYKLKS